MKTLFFLGISLLFSYQIYSKPDPNAKKLFQKIEAAYKKLGNVNASFQIESTPRESKTTIDKGSYINLNQSFRILLPDQEIYCDGKTQWTYLKSRNEIQITNADPEVMNYQPSYFATIYKSNKYDYRILEEVKLNGLPHTVIDLKPNDYNDSSFKTKLYVDKKTNLISKVEIFQKNGDKMAIVFKNVVSSKNTDNNLFLLDTKKYPKAHVEDLREE